MLSAMVDPTKSSLLGKLDKEMTYYLCLNIMSALIL